jgi:hypothetical protein
MKERLMHLQYAAVEPHTNVLPLVPLTPDEVDALRKPFRLEREWEDAIMPPAADMGFTTEIIEEAALDSCPGSDAGYTSCRT